VVGLAVACAEPGATLRETFALAKVVGEAVERYPGSELIESFFGARAGDTGGAAIAGAGGADAREPASVADRVRPEGLPLALAVSTCRDVVTVLESRAEPDEADSFRCLLADVALAVAEVSRSGGVLGIGAVRVAPAERDVVDAVRDALGFEPLRGEGRPTPTPPFPGGHPGLSEEPIRPE
jgi:hypothetical protein